METLVDISELEKENPNLFISMQFNVHVAQNESTEVIYIICSKYGRFGIRRQYRLFALCNYFKKQPTVSYIQNYNKGFFQPEKAIPKSKSEKQISVIDMIQVKDKCLELTFKDKDSGWTFEFLQPNMAVYWQTIINNFVVRLKSKTWVSFLALMPKPSDRGSVNSSTYSIINSNSQKQIHKRQEDKQNKIDDQVNETILLEEEPMLSPRVFSYRASQPQTDQAMKSSKQIEQLQKDQDLTPNEKIGLLLSQNQKMNNINRKSKSEIQFLNQQLNQKDLQLKDFIQKNNLLQSQINQLNQQNYRLLIRTTILDTYSKQVSQKCDSVLLQLQRIKRDPTFLFRQSLPQEQSIRYKSDPHQEVKKLKLQILALKRQKDKIFQQKSNVLMDFDSYKEQAESIIMNYEDETFYHIFQGKILHLSEKEFLKSSLQQYLSKKILKTTILYTFDKRNPTNFHQFIDGESNFILIAKTKQGYTLAAYSKLALQPHQSTFSQGLIFSLTNRLFFALSPCVSCLTYDQRALIFGKDQIKIVNQSSKLYSSFGLTGGHFQDRNYTIHDLLGQNEKREVELESYQVHKIIFRQQLNDVFP